MHERLSERVIVAVIAGGFALLTTVIGFFAARLVEQQDRHAEILGTHDRQIERLDVRVGHLEAARK